MNNFEIDLFDWSQLPGNFDGEDISVGLDNLLVPQDTSAASLGWTDYFSTPNVSAMTYPEARRMLNERQQSLNQTPALTQRSGSSFSTTDESCRCQDGGEGSQNDTVEGEDEEETNAPRSSGRPRTPLHNGRDPVLNRIQVGGPLEVEDIKLTRTQRRRTQNRNSQRIYRQRRMEERQRFEERAITAEEATRQLKAHLTELHSMNACLKYKVQQLETENATLRGRGEH